MSKLIDKDDCIILRGSEAALHWSNTGQGKALLVEKDGHAIIFKFDSDWTDDQIWWALLFVNAKYHHGIDEGKELARKEIRQALGVPRL